MASTVSVNGVPNLAVFCDTISLSPSRSATSGAIGAQRMPRPCLTAKFTCSAVAFSAAKSRSPSFSRSASSTTTIIRPARRRRTASETPMNTSDRRQCDRAPAWGPVPLTCDAGPRLGRARVVG